jgi:hypothetical protein
MPHGLRQLSISYQPAEDRLLFRFSTRDRKEYRLALSRRFVLRGLWPTTDSLLRADPKIRGMADEEHKKAVLSFQHEGLVDKSAFGKDFHDEDLERPLGDEPILVTGLEAAVKKGGIYVLRFKFKDGGVATVQLDAKLLHNFCKLLANAVNGADWDAELNVGSAAALTAESRVH